ncbi:UvrD-helicase domain-containing protein [Bdellovibrio bacteriovorus]|uniref:UvrD-helicase domain-containing protein n=1 Tax=Bdellovibrio bacteriovorus TaxID=959 RepID=UPI0035A67455
MSFPNEEQAAILASTRRITLVQASPGSGKTKVFSEFIRIKIKEFVDKKGGVAALSFTNSASDEISERVGVDVSPPHFVGTLDSFMYKFVLKPFAHCFGLPKKGLMILPSPTERIYGRDEVQVGIQAKEKTNLFGITFNGGTIENPVMKYQYGYSSSIEVHPTKVREVLTKKWSKWKSHGVLTHSDCQYLAAHMLSDPNLGPQIIELLALKFPWILVDEYQDTGKFLATGLLKILGNTNIRALVVGDPDQSVFEFSGASPSNFTDIGALPDAGIFPLNTTQRCARNVATASTMLSSTAVVINPREDAIPGSLFVVPHRHNNPRFDERIIDVMQSLGENLGSVMVVSRRNKDLRALDGNYVENEFKGTSVVGKGLNYALELLRMGDVKKAFLITSVHLSKVIFGTEIVRKSEAEEENIPWQKWRSEVLNLLFRLEKIEEGESWNTWLRRAKSEFENFASVFGVTVEGLGNKFRSHADGEASRELMQSTQFLHPLLINAKFKNIHEAKGREADTVVIYLPKASPAKCISNVWFPATGQSQEEQRVGFVALSRAKKNVILCVHESNFTRLRANRTAFANLFTTR